MHSFSILKSFQCVAVWPIRLNSSRPIDFVDAKNICSHAKFEMNLNNGRCSNLKIHIFVGIASIMPILNFITPVIWGKWSENKNETKFRLRKVRSLPLTFDSKQIFTSCAREYVCVCVPMIPCSGIFTISAKHSLCIEIFKAPYIHFNSIETGFFIQYFILKGFMRIYFSKICHALGGTNKQYHLLKWLLSWDVRFAINKNIILCFQWKLEKCSVEMKSNK